MCIRDRIYTVASGYGQTGPYAPRPGFDRMGLALGGFLEVTGYPDTPPVKPGISVADFYTAMFSCMAVMFAIYDRDVNGSGEGQMIDCALTESVLRLQESIIAEYSYDGTIRTRIGNGTTVTVPSGHFLTKDDKYVALSITGDKLYRDCMHQIDRQDPVSYTHLIPATIITVELEKPEYTSESFISGKIIPIAREAIIAVMANGIFSKTKEIIVIIVIIIAIVPVSYTHLDVYKRQRPTCIIFCPTSPAYRPRFSWTAQARRWVMLLSPRKARMRGSKRLTAC